MSLYIGLVCFCFFYFVPLSPASLLVEPEFRNDPHFYLNLNRPFNLLPTRPSVWGGADVLSIFREKLKHKVTPGQGTLEKHFISTVRGRHYSSSRVPLSWVVLFSTWVIPSPRPSQARGSVQVLNQAVQPVIKPLLCLHVS